MNGLRESLRKDRLAYLVIAAGILLQAYLASRSLPFLLSNLLPDDAFYYFQIARNIAEGAGSTFDGSNPTNGYHPLWMLVLLPVFSLFSDGGVIDLLPIRVALYLSVFLNIGTALVLLRLLARTASDASVRALALALFFLNPFVMFEMLNSLETSLMLLLLSLFILAAVRASERDRIIDYAIAGTTAGLMMLSRLDTVFYLVAFLGWIALRFGLRGGFRRALVAGLCASPPVLAFLAWNYASFGMLLTSASNAMQLVHHTLVVQDNGASFLTGVKAVAFSLYYYGKEVLILTGAPWLVSSLLGVAAALLATGGAILPRSPRKIPVLLFLFSGFVLIFMVNAGLRFTGRSWYFISFDLFVALGAGWTLSRLSFSGRWRDVAYAALAIALATSFLLGWYFTLRERMSNQVGMYEMVQWTNVHLAENSRIGVFNAGVQGYFSQHEIINLDGLVNNSAYEALEDRRLWSYVQEEEIAYVSDFELYLSYRFRSFLDTPDVFAELEEMHRVPVSGGAHGAPDLVLFRVLPREQDTAGEAP